MSAALLGRTTTDKPGATALLRIANSEVAVHIRVAGRLMPVQITTGSRYRWRLRPPSGAPSPSVRPGSTPAARARSTVRPSSPRTSQGADRVPGQGYVFTDKGRVPNPFRCFGGGPRRRPPRRRRGPPAENRHTPTFWTRFTPVCLDARVTHTYEAQGRNGEHRATLWSEKRSSPPTSRPSTLRSSLPPAGDAATPRGTRTSWTAPEPSPTCSAAGRPSKG